MAVIRPSEALASPVWGHWALVRHSLCESLDKVRSKSAMVSSSTPAAPRLAMP